MEYKNTGIIVLGGHVQGLGVLRILGREGVPGIIIDNTYHNIARHSKYCDKFYNVKNDELLSFLIDLGNREVYKNWILFPTNDFHVKILSKNKSILEKCFNVSVDSWNIIKHFYNKIDSYKLARKINIPIAVTFFPKDKTELDNIFIKYPCIIKPAIMHDFYHKAKKKAFLCKDLTELKSNYNRACEIIPANEIIIQEVIKGPSKNQFSACFLFLNGKSYVQLAACRMRQHPLDFGNATTYAETADVPVIIEYAKKLLKEVGYNGVCEAEFKYDERDKEYKFLEVNTRTWKWHTIANKAKTPFLKNYYDYLTGKKIKPVYGFDKASFFHFITDMPIRILLLLKGYKYWNRMKKPVENAVWAKDDIKPWIFEKFYLPQFIFKR